MPRWPPSAPPGRADSQAKKIVNIPTVGQNFHWNGGWTEGRRPALFGQGFRRHTDISVSDQCSRSSFDPSKAPGAKGASDGGAGAADHPSSRDADLPGGCVDPLRRRRPSGARLPRRDRVDRCRRPRKGRQRSIAHRTRGQGPLCGQTYRQEPGGFGERGPECEAASGGNFCRPA